MESLDHKDLIVMQTYHVDVLQRALNEALDGLEYYVNNTDDNAVAKQKVEQIHKIMGELSGIKVGGAVN